MVGVYDLRRTAAGPRRTRRMRRSAAHHRRVRSRAEEHHCERGHPGEPDDTELGKPGSRGDADHERGDEEAADQVDRVAAEGLADDRLAAAGDTEADSGEPV